jgi:hypothetical protein
MIEALLFAVVCLCVAIAFLVMEVISLSDSNQELRKAVFGDGAIEPKDAPNENGHDPMSVW